MLFRPHKMFWGRDRYPNAHAGTHTWKCDNIMKLIFSKISTYLLSYCRSDDVDRSRPMETERYRSDERHRWAYGGETAERVSPKGVQHRQHHSRLIRVLCK